MLFTSATRCVHCATVAPSDTCGAGGRLLESRVVNRSAPFVFNIDERFFGTLIAYVPGAQAAGYDFTSGLPEQLFWVLAPQLMPLINGKTSSSVVPAAEYVQTGAAEPSSPGVSSLANE